MMHGFQNQNQTKLKAISSMCSSLLATCSRGVSGATLVATASASSLTLWSELPNFRPKIMSPLFPLKYQKYDPTSNQYPNNSLSLLGKVKTILSV